MNKVMKEMISTLLYLLLVLCLTWIVITFVGQRTEVDGASMEMTLMDGDNLIVDKISYRFHDPARFDIIARSDTSTHLGVPLLPDVLKINLIFFSEISS